MVKLKKEDNIFGFAQYKDIIDEVDKAVVASRARGNFITADSHRAIVAEVIKFYIENGHIPNVEIDPESNTE